MKICKQCGAEVADNASFCAKCGAKMEATGNAGGAGNTENMGNAVRWGLSLRCLPAISHLMRCSM